MNAPIRHPVGYGTLVPSLAFDAASEAAATAEVYARLAQEFASVNDRPGLAYALRQAAAAIASAADAAATLSPPVRRGGA